MASKPAALIIVAAGRGARFGGLPKQYQPLAGKPVLAHLLARASAIPAIGPIIVVTHPDDGAFYTEAVQASGIDHRRVFRAPGGESRQASVRNGLELLAAAEFPASSMVLIHDAARPFLSEVVVLRGLIAAGASGAAIPTLPVVDTVAELDAEGHLKGNPDRNRLGLVQTPQVFRFGMILEAHRAAAISRKADFTDDASLAAASGATVATFPGEPDLFKITHTADLARAEAHLAEGRPHALRTGLGFDVHAFTTGEFVMIGGVKIPHDRALLGHSDADPLLHAMTDALLGAIGDGDIGQHFPPGDPRWKGAASIRFLIDARRRVEARGGRILNLDGTVICEAPRIGPHREAIITLIAEALDLPREAVGIKATTSEKLGFTGRGEGIAAMAVATVALAPNIRA
jgi:2-C-methyl-D-erythritol 4-phosphate cytidylyltransferase/2-C-methyl-D-erythritol 2,4-cyclodiphosphate synthase